MKVLDLLYGLGLEDLAYTYYDESESESESDERINAILEMDVEVHFQPSYPLKSGVDNVRELHGKMALALGGSEGYGSREAWQEPGEEDCHG